ncbi:MAG: hypothetical protein CVV04_08645 [Firmicutes bacterium HGW-Firmicutes-9]|jgi:uncharacterized protein (DUF58 family)|nr:MAG: hypothetical protein CVV04_08645 [Firmicutes bacterium HGW-Firmicutes-9]
MAGNRVLYIYALFFAFILFVLFDLYLFHLLLIFLVLLPVVSLLAALPMRKNLRYALEIEDDIMPKGVCGIRLSARNNSPFPCAGVRFTLERHNALGRVGDRYTESAEDVVQFPLGPMRAHAMEPSVKMAHCGRVDLSIWRVQVLDTLGLFALNVSPKNGATPAGSVYVLPELQSRSIQTDEAADLGLDSAHYSTQKAGGDPSEIFQLRDYREGDPRHSVHWKLSSRMNRLIVREFGLPLNPSLHFLLELREDSTPDAAEAMIGTMLAFSEYLMAREIMHSISWIGEEGGLCTMPVTGPEALASVLHDLLALPGQARWSTLERFATEGGAREDTHLIYLVAGSVYRAAEDEAGARLLATMTTIGACRRLTLMPYVCDNDTADAIRDLGCEVQLLDGSVPGAETEADA